jgi:hypothetical protein
VFFLSILEWIQERTYIEIFDREREIMLFRRSRLSWKMQDQTNNVPLNQYTSPGSQSRFGKAIDQEEVKVAAFAKEDWGRPTIMLLSAVVLAAIAGLVLWFTIGSNFDDGHALDGNVTGWVASGKGILFLFIIGLLFASSALTLGLAFMENWKAGAAMLVAVIIYSVLVHFTVDAAAKGETITTAVLFLVSFFVIGGLAVYGFYTLFQAHSKSFSNPKDSAGVKSHYTFAIGSLGVTIVMLIVYSIAWFKIYNTIGNSP